MASDSLALEASVDDDDRSALGPFLWGKEKPAARAFEGCSNQKQGRQIWLIESSQFSTANALP